MSGAQLVPSTRWESIVELKGKSLVVPSGSSTCTLYAIAPVTGVKESAGIASVLVGLPAAGDGTGSVRRKVWTGDQLSPSLVVLVSFALTRQYSVTFAG